MPRSLWLLILCIAAASAPAASAQQWRNIGPPGGSVISLVTMADGSAVLGTADGHVFRAEGMPLQWRLAGRISGRHDAVVQELIADAATPGRLFAAVWFRDAAAGGGVFRSEDSGTTWVPAGLQGEAVRAIEQTGSHPRTLVAGTRSGVFRSSDAGVSWARISSARDAELRDLDSIAVDPRDPRIIYAGTYHLPWKTVDGGATWKSIATGMIDDSDVMSLRIDAAQNTRVFASACSGIYRSDNSGAQWAKLQGIPYTARRSQQIVQDSRDPRTLFAATTSGLWITHDVGDSWARTTPADWVVNAVTLLLAAAADRPPLVLLGTEAGLMVSADGGTTFSAANSGFSHRVLEAFAALPGEPRHLLVEISGARHDLLETHDGGVSWSPLPGVLPAGGAQALYGAAGTWLAALRAGGLARYDAAAHTWRRVTLAQAGARRASPVPRRTPGETPRNVPHAEVWPDVRALCASSERLFVATSRGLWSGEERSSVLRPMRPMISPGISGDLRDVSCTHGIWLATPDRILHQATDGGEWRSWTLPAGAGEFQWIRSLALPGVTVVLAGTTHGVFALSNDAGSWRAVEHGLPATSTSPAAASGSRIAIVAASGVLYVSKDGGNSWDRSPASAEFRGEVFAAAAGGFVAATDTDGLLAWQP